MNKNWNIRIVVHGNERIVYSGSDFQKASMCVGEIILKEPVQQMRIWQDGDLFQVIDIFVGSDATQALQRVSPKGSKGPDQNLRYYFYPEGDVPKKDMG